MKKELCFTLTMAGLMCFAMCSFNYIWINGLNIELLTILLYYWTIEFLIAFCLVFFIVRHVMRQVSHFFAFIQNNKLTFYIVMPVCNVLIMAPIMSLLVLVLIQGQFYNLKSIYPYALIRNICAALVFQIFIVGPFVRRIFQTR